MEDQLLQWIVDIGLNLKLEAHSHYLMDLVLMYIIFQHPNIVNKEITIIIILVIVLNVAVLKDQVIHKLDVIIDIIGIILVQLQ